MLRIVLVCMFVMLSAPSYAQSGGSKCAIAEEKKRLIVSSLCGEAAKEREYKFTGPNCIQASTRKRLEDSAIQIVVYNRCGDPSFAALLKDATIKSVRFTQIMATCSNEKFDVQKMMDQAMIDVQKKVGGFQCEADIKRTLTDRKASFETIIQRANDPATERRIFERLGIVVDSSGNISEKK